jgi:oxalate---CoA ligase
MAVSTLSSALQPSAKPAVIIPTHPYPFTLSYSELLLQIETFQRILADLGINSGDAVSIALPNSLEFIVSFLAAANQRAIAAPLNPAYKEGEFDFYITDLESALILVPKGAVANNEPSVRAARKHGTAVAECYLAGSTVNIDLKDKGRLVGKSPSTLATPQAEDVALVLHTSGTTGRPKAVPLSHRNLTRTMKNIQQTYDLTPNDRTMLVMPLFHVHGLLAGFLAPLMAGGSAIVPLKFSASTFWEDFITHEATWYTAVPTIHQILLKNPPPNPKPKIRFIRSCSSALSPKVFHDLEKAFSAPVLEAYAMTEAAHQMCSNPLPHRGKRKPGSVGLGQGVEVKILDASGEEVSQGTEAEICIRGENVTRGYINNEKANQESFTADGFFRTGDQGKKDEDGYIVITGRIKELINRGGEKISPIELDNLIATSPQVSEAVTFGIPSEMLGQEVGVAVVAKQGVSVTEKEIVDFVASKLSSHKKPSRVSSPSIKSYLNLKSMSLYKTKIKVGYCSILWLTFSPGVDFKTHPQNSDREGSEKKGRGNFTGQRFEGEVVELKW